MGSYVEVLSCFYATIQDLGRLGYRALGVPVSGALDRLSAAYANALVSNNPGEALIEAVGGSIELRAGSDVVVAVTGARCVATVDGYEVDMWKPIYLRAGSVLRVSSPQRGSVVYVAIAGGIDVPRVMGSRSTYLRARFGGYMGRALKPGDRLPVAEVDARRRWEEVSGRCAPSDVVTRALPRGVVELRATRGIHAEVLEPDLRTLLSSTYSISPKSDRMGYRLEGPELPRAKSLGRLVTVAVDRGYVQVPPDGRPIVLMADSQTTGGYAVALHVLPPDVDRLAQCPPGSQVRFVEVGQSEAENIVRKYFEELESPMLVSVEEEEYLYY